MTRFPRGSAARATRSAARSAARSATRSAARSAGRRVVATVLAASIGAGLTLVALELVPERAVTSAHRAGAVDRTPERPSRAHDRHPGRHGLAARLLPRRALSTVSGAAGGAAGWTVVRTEPHEPRGLASSCHRFPLVSVGAYRVAHRAYALGRPSAPRATAAHVVARFVDSRTAGRALEVLHSWQAGCADAHAHLGGVRFSGPRTVDGVECYALTWIPAGAVARVREDVAVARVGERLAIVSLTAPAHHARTGRRMVLAAADAARALLR